MLLQDPQLCYIFFSVYFKVLNLHHLGGVWTIIGGSYFIKFKGMKMDWLKLRREVVYTILFAGQLFSLSWANYILGAKFSYSLGLCTISLTDMWVLFYKPDIRNTLSFQRYINIHTLLRALFCQVLQYRKVTSRKLIMFMSHFMVMYNFWQDCRKGLNMEWVVDF